MCLFHMRIQLLDGKVQQNFFGDWRDVRPIKVKTLREQLARIIQIPRQKEKKVCAREIRTRMQHEQRDTSFACSIRGAA